MIRRIVMGAAALAFPVSVLTVGQGMSPAGASSPPVTFSGSITCAMKGVIDFKPGLIQSAAGTTTVKLVADLKNCTGDTTSDGVTVKTGVVKLLSTTTGSRDCGSVTNAGQLPDLTGKIKWTAKHGDAASTLVTSIAGAFIYQDSANGTLDLVLPSSATTGSFAGNTTQTTVMSTIQQSKLLASCNTKRGLKSIAFGKKFSASLSIEGASS